MSTMAAGGPEFRGRCRSPPVGGGIQASAKLWNNKQSQLGPLSQLFAAIKPSNFHAASNRVHLPSTPLLHRILNFHPEPQAGMARLPHRSLELLEVSLCVPIVDASKVGTLPLTFELHALRTRAKQGAEGSPNRCHRAAIQAPTFSILYSSSSICLFSSSTSSLLP